MKAVGEIQILGREKTRLRLDSSFTTALGIREDVVLYGVVPEIEHSDQTGPCRAEDDRLMTLIVTPFPQGCWSRLIRMSVTIDSKPGTLYSLIKGLNSLHIFPRHVEDVTGTNVSARTLTSVNAEVHGIHEGTEPILPSAMLVVELPRNFEQQDSRLHSGLSAILKDSGKSAEAIPLLEEALRTACGQKVKVRWISPMATLNRLGARFKAQKLRVTRWSSRVEGEDGLEIDLQPWRNLLWRHDTIAPYNESQTEILAKRLVAPSLDSDERVIAWYFYSYPNHLVVEFEVTAPAFGLEHLWWEYIYECVKEARGSVLGTSSSSRVKGRWSTLRSTAMFQLKVSDDQPEDPSRILHCFRKLQGDRSATREFASLIERVNSEHAAIGSLILEGDAEGKWRAEEIGTSSQLERLVVWDPFEDSPSPRFSGLFGENPFTFTFPLELDRYEDLYGTIEPSKVHRTRLHLAEQVKSKLEQDLGENVAIVGAHRAGKTTVLNLVYGLLRRRLETSESTTLVPVRLTASVTPPHMLFFRILEEIRRLQGENHGASTALIRKFGKRIAKIGGSLLTAIEIQAGPVTIKPGETVKTLRESSATEAKEGEEERLRSLLVRVEDDRKGSLPEFLRQSLLALRDALGTVPVKTRLVIIMDEFAESTEWGDHRTLAVLRHAIESKDFCQIKWLISTSRPIREVSPYSPITNIFCEYNVGSLRRDECHRLIDAFSYTAWQAEVADSERLRPVITYPARRFLMSITSSLPYLLQVCCYHIYDRVTKRDFPLISKALCRKVVVQKVLPELADYLERQWSQVPDGARRFITDSLADLPHGLRRAAEFLRFSDGWTVDVGEMPPGSLKALDRSGLRGDDGRCVAPLVGAWLLFGGLEEE